MTDETTGLLSRLTLTRKCTRRQLIMYRESLRAASSSGRTVCVLIICVVFSPSSASSSAVRTK